MIGRHKRGYVETERGLAQLLADTALMLWPGTDLDATHSLHIAGGRGPSRCQSDRANRPNSQRLRVRRPQSRDRLKHIL